MKLLIEQMEHLDEDLKVPVKGLSFVPGGAGLSDAPGKVGVEESVSHIPRAAPCGPLSQKSNICHSILL